MGVNCLGICLTGEIGFEVKEKPAGYGKEAKTKKRWVRESGGRDFMHALHERTVVFPK